MAKFSLNPLNWFKRKQQPSSSSSPPRPGFASTHAVHPRKSGKIFLHLINLQKLSQSMNLALRQGIDCSVLVQKATSEVSLLKVEAGTVGEEELAQAAGQVMAYFQTVSEKRLGLDEEGIALVRDLIAIFKDALGDAAPGIRTLDGGQLEAWNSRYQSLMARMKPIEESVEQVEPDEAETDEDELLEQASDGVANIAPVRETSSETSGQEDTSRKAEASEHSTDLRDKLARAMAAVESSGEKHPVSEIEQEVSDEADDLEPLPEMGIRQPPPVEDLPPYDPAEEVQVRDVVISDAEVGSAREYMALGKSKPQFVPQEDQPATQPTPKDSGEDLRRPPREGENIIVKSPVQIEEVERLKRKLLELHEKQEMLSSKMSGILGDLKKAVRGDQASRGRAFPDELDVDDLENLIFIGRKKG